MNAPSARRSAAPRAATRQLPPTREELAESFDVFYKESRDRLLLQTFALTGDINAARSAVRDAFVVAWHHWRALDRRGAPEMEVRPHAWRNAQRRRTAKPWGRTKGQAADEQATLDALATLTVPQRSALLLTQLAAVSMPEMAREIDLPLEAAERELQAAAARFATARDIPTSAIPVLLAGLGSITATVTWPRPTIIRRAGAARSRAHTILGVTAAVIALVGAGAVVGDPTGVRPRLDQTAPPAATTPPLPPAQVSLPDTALLPEFEVSGRLSGRWQEQRTTDNSTGNGLVHPCQAERYADPRGVAGWARTFRLADQESEGQGGVTRRYVQTAEASANAQQARRAYQRALTWFAACRAPENSDPADLPHTQLISTATAGGVGEEAAVLVLEDTGPNPDRRATDIVGLARTGNFVTVTSLRTDVVPERADRDGVADLLGIAVERLCALPDGGGCVDEPVRLRDRPAFPIGRASALLDEIDLPPVALDQGSLVGTPSRRVTGNRGDISVLGCDAVRLLNTYGRTEIRTNLYRTFVFVDSDLPPATGLTEVVGTLPRGRAAAFVEELRDQITGCPDQDDSAGTEVTRLFDGGDEGGVWRLETALPNDQSVQYDVAVVRRGTALAQLVYVSAPDARIDDADFVDLAMRARERLAELPSYRSGD